MATRARTAGCFFRRVAFVTRVPVFRGSHRRQRHSQQKTRKYPDPGCTRVLSLRPTSSCIVSQAGISYFRVLVWSRNLFTICVWVVFKSAASLKLDPSGWVPGTSGTKLSHMDANLDGLFKGRPVRPALKDVLCSRRKTIYIAFDPDPSRGRMRAFACCLGRHCGR